MLVLVLVLVPVLLLLMNLDDLDLYVTGLLYRDLDLALDLDRELSPSPGGRDVLSPWARIPKLDDGRGGAWEVARVRHGPPGAAEHAKVTLSTRCPPSARAQRPKSSHWQTRQRPQTSSQTRQASQGPEPGPDRSRGVRDFFVPVR